jgi:hypothetical protein
MFDLGKHLALGSSLFRTLSRKFGVTGKLNDIVAGVFLKSLFNAHPNPEIHLNNFCLKLTSTGHSALQKALTGYKVEDITTNFLLRICNSVYDDRSKRPTDFQNEDPLQSKTNCPPMGCATEKFGIESHDGKQQPNCETTKQPRRRKALNCKIENLERSINKIVSKLDERDSRMKHNSEIIHVIKQEKKVEEQPQRKKTNNEIMRERLLNSLKSEDDSSASTKSKKRGGSQVSRSPIPQTQKHARSYGLDLSVVSPYLLADFGGDLSRKPHGDESYDEYDSDHYERCHTAERVKAQSKVRKKT